MRTKDLYLRTAAIILAVLIIGFIGHRLFLCSNHHPQVQQSPPDINTSSAKPISSTNTYTVERVIDGDTLVLDNGQTIRLIGVDTPETNHPEIPLQRFGKEATEFTRRMVEGMKVTLEPKELSEDSYGRKLAYVFVNNVLVNKEIIRRGYGYAYRRFPHPRMKEFIAAEREARSKQYGLWNYSLTDGRVTNLLNRYEQLNTEGKEKFEEILDELIQMYPISDKTGEPND
jgi:micrococcal nuclease